MHEGGQFCAAQDAHHAFQVIGHCLKANLDPGSGNAAQQEARMAEDAVLQGREGMLDVTSSGPHDGRSGSFLHAHKGRLVQMQIDCTLGGRGAAAL